MTASLPLLRPTRLPDFASAPTLAARGLGPERLALGVAGIGGAWMKVDEGESVATLLHALERGVRAFDSAPAYVDGEKLLGRALAQWRGPRPIISTKTGRLPARSAHEGNFDFSTASMRTSLERSLALLGVPQVDLLFLHDPQIVPPPERPRVVDALRQLQADGLARHLGLAGGDGAGWNGFVETGAFAVAMLFRRLDPCIFAGLRDDVPRVRRAGMLTYGASPLHMGLLGARYDEFLRDQPEWVWPPQRARAVKLRALAERHGLALPSLAHRFMFGLAEVDRVVIGASNRAQLDAALADFAAGPLPLEIFDEVCQVNVAAGSASHG